MKKTLYIIWIVISSIVTLFSVVELAIGFSLWLKETEISFWGPNSIIHTILLLLGITSLVLSIIYFIKWLKRNN